MNKNVLFRILVALLAMTLCVSVFAGCTGCGKKSDIVETDEDTEKQTSGKGESGSESGNKKTEQETEQSHYRDNAWKEDDPNAALYKPAQKTYNRDYTMLTYYENYYYHLYTYVEEDDPSEICDVAIWQRQVYLEEQFGINLKRLTQTSTEAKQTFTNSMASGDNVCDITCFSGSDTMTYAMQGYLIDVNQMTGLNLEAPYWDQRIQEEYRVGDYLFALDGDFNFLDDLQTYVVIYNDTMYNGLGFYDSYGSPYELSEAGQWTYETMLEMINTCGTVNPELKEGGTWAMVSECPASYYFLLGSGTQMIVNDEGTMTVNFKENYETIYNLIEEYMELAKNQNIIVADRPNVFNDSSNIWTTASEIFSLNRALFRSTALSAVLRLLDMEDDYGIMPIPAYTATTDGSTPTYHCWVKATGHCPMAFPRTSATNKEEMQELCEVTEIFAYYSLYGADSLNRAFYDLMAYAKLCRRPEDKLMLQLVFSNKTYDIDNATGFANVQGIINSVAMNQTYDTLSSKLSAIKDSAEETMKKWVSDLVVNVSKNHPDFSK